MQLLKIKVQEVIEENRLLHEELKRTAISEIVGGGLEIPGVRLHVYIYVPTKLPFSHYILYIYTFNKFLQYKGHIDQLGLSIEQL